MFEIQRLRLSKNALMATCTVVLGLQIFADCWVMRDILTSAMLGATGGTVLVLAAVGFALCLLGAWTFIAWSRQVSQSRLDRFYEMLRDDALTGLLNRTFFLDRVRTEANNGTLMVIDVDHFKAVNDQYGHYTGDAVLTQLAAAMSFEVGASGYLGRLGGEEFGVFLPSVSGEMGFERAEQLRRAIASIHFEFDGVSLNLSVSVGITEYTNRASIGQALRRADDNLYAAKKAGRNCVADQANPVILLQSRIEQSQRLSNAGA